MADVRVDLTGPGGERAGSYKFALGVLASVFFIWGFATVLNDILVPHLKSVFDLNYGQSLLIQFVFYLGYFIMSLPAARLLERIGYKASVVTGLIGMAAAALCFVPAAGLASFGVFLAALFMLASAICLLQVAANPYVAVIGPPASASSRLTLVQAFNSMGTFFAPMFGSLLILGRSSGGTAEGGQIALTEAERIADAQAVQLPYLIIALVLGVLAVVIWKTRLPDLDAQHRRAARVERKSMSLWRHRNLTLGVVAIFIYLIAEIGVGSLLVNFIAQPEIGNLTHEEAGFYLSLFWGGAMVGRFVGAAVMTRVKPEYALAGVSVGAAVLAAIVITTSGSLAMWAVIAIGLCHSIMFPTIFTLGIRGLGPLTEEGSGLLIMAIAGGALAALQGVIADRYGLQLSFILPGLCYLYVLFYALWGSKVTGEPAGR
jgi:FHS family L-fucose permease-like MFS transporter